MGSWVSNKFTNRASVLYFTDMISRTFLNVSVLKEFFLILLPMPKTLTFSSVRPIRQVEYIKYFFQIKMHK